MKKNLFRTGIGLVVGGSLLITSSLITMADGPSGYETLKAAVKNSHKIQNATLSLSGSVSDNNKEVVKVTSTFKANEKDHTFSGTVAVNSEKIKKGYTMFANEKSMIFKDDASNIYNRVEYKDGLEGKSRKNRNHKFDEKANPQLEALGEKILDTLVGDLKKQVEQKSLENGEKQISINLDKNEIPSLVDLMLAAKNDKCEDTDNKDKVHEILGINPDDLKMSELTSDIHAEKIDIRMVVDKDNNIKELDAEFDVTGKDAQNQAHSKEIKFSADVSDVNSTVVDTINLHGKNVKNLKHSDFGSERD